MVVVSHLFLFEKISGAGVTRASHTGPSLGLSISRQPLLRPSHSIHSRAQRVNTREIERNFVWVIQAHKSPTSRHHIIAAPPHRSDGTV